MILYIRRAFESHLSYFLWTPYWILVEFKSARNYKVNDVPQVVRNSQISSYLRKKSFPHSSLWEIYRYAEDLITYKRAMEINAYLVAFVVQYHSYSIALKQLKSHIF